MSPRSSPASKLMSEDVGIRLLDFARVRVYFYHYYDDEYSIHCYITCICMYICMCVCISDVELLHWNIKLRKPVISADLMILATYIIE